MQQQKLLLAESLHRLTIQQLSVESETMGIAEEPVNLHRTASVSSFSCYRSTNDLVQLLHNCLEFLEEEQPFFLNIID